MSAAEKINVDPFEQTKRELEIWGVWSLVGGGCGLGAKSQLVERVMGGICLDKFDEIGLLMDKCVGLLIKHDPKMGGLVFDYYRSNDGLAVVGKKRGLSRIEARSWLRGGECWINCAKTFLK